MSEAFLKVVNMSISAGWLVLAVLMLRVILRKAPKWIHVLLWGIVAVRLISPFSIESSLSLIPSAETISPSIMMDWTPEISTGIESLNKVVNPVITSSFTPQPYASANPLQILIPVWANIWLLGILFMLIYTAISYLSLRRKMATAVIFQNNLFQCEAVNSPFVLGIFKPKIYLPYSLDGQNLKHVVAHEQAHIRRKDHWWKPLGFLLLMIHWFNPLMWVAYILLCRDIELACDEKVISKLGNEQRADYTQALVVCSVNRRMTAACPLAFGEVGVKERVKSVMNYKKPAFWIIVLAILSCTIVAVCFLTNPKQDSFTLRIVVPAGSQEQFVYTNEEVSTTKNSIKIWSGDGLGDTEVLLFPVDKATEAGHTAEYLTHGMPVVFDAERDTWFKVGVNVQNPTGEDIIVYVEVENVEVRISDKSYTVREWFDYLDNPSAMRGGLTTELPDYPGVNFQFTRNQIIASKPFRDSVLTGPITLIDGMPIWNAYFSDLTGDGYPDICATYTYGSGIIDSRIIIRDYVNGASYELADRGYHDFALWLNESDGQLYVNKRVHPNGELVSSGHLVFKDGCIQIEEVLSSDSAFDKYYLTIGAEGVTNIEISLPNSSGGCQNADGSPFKFGERIWLEPLDGVADLRGLQITALDEAGKIIWSASIPSRDVNEGFTHLTQDAWTITNLPPDDSNVDAP